MFVGVYLILLLLVVFVALPYDREMTWREYFTNHEKLKLQTDGSGGAEKIGMPIYYINLDRSTERKDRMVEEFTEMGLEHMVRRVSGIDGQELSSMQQGEANGIKYVNQFTAQFSEIGCTLSHLKAIKRAFDDGCEHALICEDDVSFKLMSFWKHTVPELMVQLTADAADSGDWHIMIIYNRANATYNPPQFFHQFNRCGTVAYVINREGMTAVLDKTYDETTDTFQLLTKDSNEANADMFIYVVSGKAFIYSKSLVYTHSTLSTIHNKHIFSHLSHSNRIIEGYLEEMRKEQAKLKADLENAPPAPPRPKYHASV